MRTRRQPRAIDFDTATHEELDEYGMGLLALEEAPELSKVLRGHLLIERTIETLVSRKLEKPKKFFHNHRVTFEMKVDLADALGVLPPPYVSAAKALNNIRNAYAHREDHKLSVEELNALKINWVPIQKQAYAAALAKGPEEAAGLAIIFLNWSFLRLLHPSQS
ncbi:hypothetical protein KGA65_05660 [Ideonella sp. B7]|nr:hypothetical protein [Ideonella benzenivorans]